MTTLSEMISVLFAATWLFVGFYVIWSAIDWFVHPGTKKAKALWSLDDGIEFVRVLNKRVGLYGFNVAILGSVLYKGRSNKDLDIAVFPLRRNPDVMNRFVEIREALCAAGLSLRHDYKTVWARWRKQGSDDDKLVEIWEDETGRRIDVFYLS